MTRAVRAGGGRGLAQEIEAAGLEVDRSLKLGISRLGKEHARAGRIARENDDRFAEGRGRLDAQQHRVVRGERHDWDVVVAPGVFAVDRFSYDREALALV
jgi:hypothetical protein